MQCDKQETMAYSSVWSGYNSLTGQGKAMSRICDITYSMIPDSPPSFCPADSHQQTRLSKSCFMKQLAMAQDIFFGHMDGWNLKTELHIVVDML